MRRVLTAVALSAALSLSVAGGAQALVASAQTEYSAALAACVPASPACAAAIRAYVAKIGLTGTALVNELAALENDFVSKGASRTALQAQIDTATAGPGAGPGPGLNNASPA